jgi:signal transduction histidine kinase
MSRRSVSQWFTVAAVALTLVTAVGAALGIYAIVRLSDARHVVVDRNGPAALATLRLTNALLNQETGVSNYALTGVERFLASYRDGRREARAAFAELDERTRVGALKSVRDELLALRSRAAEWERAAAVPTLASVRREGPRAAGAPGARRGRMLFDDVRGAAAALDRELLDVRAAGRQDLANAASFLSGAFIAILALIGLGIAGVAVGLRIVVNRPLQRLGRLVRRTASGAFDEPIVGRGPRDVVALSADVDSMRRRIVDELSQLKAAHAQLDEQASELQRSNTELEQFAYVASHDLQEPLRKIASFCQLLEQRYADELDERGRQYVTFAVDGAKRMQQLINDLLAFSRVGRSPLVPTRIELDAVLDQARVSLATAIEETDAEIAAPPLPAVTGEPTLLAAVFQNLIGNALKFHGDEPPRIEIDVAREDDEWVISCSDSGIGIEPEYAERIFLIFQRLHPKDVYAGTGIGLALCRKIVEFHGGRIWLDTESGNGTTFRFTLPVIEETP